MKLIAQKPCSFEGKKFYIGDEIPCELVNNPKAQEKMGVITIASSTGESLNMSAHKSVGKFEIIIHAEEDNLQLWLTNEELSVFTEIAQIGVTKAEDKQKIAEMIQKIESEELLIMLDALDSRKYVKEKAQERAQVILGVNEEFGGDI